MANTPEDILEWYTVDDEHVYFSDCSTVWSVPKQGGFPTTLTTGERSCTFGPGNVELDSTDLFFIRASRVVRLPKAGGQPEPLGSTGAVTVAADRDNVYWMDLFDETIKTAPKQGGAEQTIASVEISSLRRFVAHAGYLYWMESDGFARLPTTGPFPTAPATLPLSTAPYDFAIADNSIFFVSYGSGGTVGSLPLAGGSWTGLATSQSSPEWIATDGSSVYWISSSQQRAEIRKVSLAGGAPTTVAELRVGSRRDRVVVDATHVYWAEGQTLMRAPK